MDREEARGKKVADLAAESPFPSDTLELEVFRNQLRERIITVRGANTDKEPLRFRVRVLFLPFHFTVYVWSSSINNSNLS